MNATAKNKGGRPKGSTWDEPALERIAAVHWRWSDALEDYNRETGQTRTLYAIRGAAKDRGIRLGLAPPDAWDDGLLARVAPSAPSWEHVAIRYNGETGQGRKLDAIRDRAKTLGLVLGRRSEPGKSAGQGRQAEPAYDHGGVMARAQRIRLYKDAHNITGGIKGRRLREAVEGDVDSWPDGAPPGDLDCSGMDRDGGRVHRIRLPRGRAS